MDINKLLSIINTGRILIQTHDYPDPDAITSAFGLQYLLKHFGVETSICFKGFAERASVNNLVKEFSIPLLTPIETMAIQPTDKIILVDGQKLNANMTNLPGDEVACIDHHPIFKQVDYQYSDIRLVGACASIIADYFVKSKVKIPCNIATLLLYGLMVDTHSMTRGVADLDLDIFPMLYRSSDPERFTQLEAKSLEFSDLQAFGAAINNIRVYGRTGFASIPFSCPDALVAQVADFILSLVEVDIAIIHARREQGWKYSVRSVLPEVHSGYMLAEVMPPYGTGGGHARMAAGFIPKENIIQTGMDKAQFESMLEERFLNYIEKHLAEKDIKNNSNDTNTTNETQDNQ